MAVKADPRNVGKLVKFVVAGQTERTGTIVRFRGGYVPGCHAAFVQYRMPSGQYRCISIELRNLDYVKGVQK